MKLLYSNQVGAKIDKRIFTSLLPKIKSAKITSLTILDDAEIKKINKRYRGKNKPTDVISFAYEDSDQFPGEEMLGEIYISIDTARRQSKELSHTLKYELQFLFVHGVLHLLGYTHETEKDDARMMAAANKILE
ncbi:rRNA maturation RNase YbeY [Candidatus Peregrinibacteria bacterium RIFOXYC2_FULL_41_22]|nr:MAG: rRNA maturation RNase YbeY [Candidatus Peregrinibacteria bacterium RIFOXYC2_FULL_41_22]